MTSRCSPIKSTVEPFYISLYRSTINLALAWSQLYPLIYKDESLRLAHSPAQIMCKGRGCLLSQPRMTSSGLDSEFGACNSNLTLRFENTFRSLGCGIVHADELTDQARVRKAMANWRTGASRRRLARQDIVRTIAPCFFGRDQVNAASLTGPSLHALEF
ncbi:hypothetical protein HI914_05435 [Erysiphe necator]|nr:hypothetical protein HI914_05435 [Erysiphe necator]